MFEVFQRYVSYECCNGSFRMLHMLQWLYTYVARVCSKCFICFRHMLQIYVQMFDLFEMYVAIVSSECCKVDLDMGLLSGEERASAIAIVASMWGGGAGRVAPVWKRRRSHPSGVEEARREAVWKRRAGRCCGRDGAESSGRRVQRSERQQFERGHGKRSR
jgi:hypothetical protein